MIFLNHPNSKSQPLKVISNENMAANETNIFQPLFKQDEHANMLRQQIIDWAREQRKRLEQVDMDRIIKNLEVGLDPSILL